MKDYIERLRLGNRFYCPEGLFGGSDIKQDAKSLISERYDN